MDVNEELKFLRKFKNKIGGGGSGVGVSGGVGLVGGQGGCERRIEVFVKIQKKHLCVWGGDGFGLGLCQDGCEQRIEVL